MSNQPSGAAVMKSFIRACTKKQQKVVTETDSSKSTTKKTFVVAPYVQGGFRKSETGV